MFVKLDRQREDFYYIRNNIMGNCIYHSMANDAIKLSSYKTKSLLSEHKILLFIYIYISYSQNIAVISGVENIRTYTCFMYVTDY